MSNQLGGNKAALGDWILTFLTSVLGLCGLSHGLCLVLGADGTGAVRRPEERTLPALGWRCCPWFCLQELLKDPQRTVL